MIGEAEEVVALVALFALGALILLPGMGGGPNSGVRVCATNLKGIYTAMFIYANSYDGCFPMWDASPNGIAAGRGFAPARSASTYTAGTDNPTAALWLLVRDGSVSPEMFVCPSTDDWKDSLTDNGLPEGTPVPLGLTWDFYDRSHLSYSMPDMYRTDTQVQWSTNADPNWVILADANNGDDPLRPGNGRKDRRKRNSKNHDDDGQDAVMADTSSRWYTDVDVGPEAVGAAGGGVDGGVVSEDVVVFGADHRVGVPP